MSYYNSLDDIPGLWPEDRLSDSPFRSRVVTSRRSAPPLDDFRRTSKRTAPAMPPSRKRRRFEQELGETRPRKVRVTVARKQTQNSGYHQALEGAATAVRALFLDNPVLHRVVGGWKWICRGVGGAGEQWARYGEERRKQRVLARKKLAKQQRMLMRAFARGGGGVGISVPGDEKSSSLGEETEEQEADGDDYLADDHVFPAYPNLSRASLEELPGDARRGVFACHHCPAVCTLQRDFRLHIESHYYMTGGAGPAGTIDDDS